MAKLEPDSTSAVGLLVMYLGKYYIKMKAFLLLLPRVPSPHLFPFNKNSITFPLHY